ncbi:MAG: glycyl-radical enzyme activating protein [Gemmatimonadota bacterium]|jgi:pyruvate formate lyase activating enzyme
MNSGNIFDIKRFAIHDGPGLRTTVFLKGCPLSCLGCHNPEGQGNGPELLFRPDRCTLCGDCVPACPHEAISLEPGGTSGSHEGGREDSREIEIDWERCRLDGACVRACLPGALELVGESKSVEEVLTILEADRIYFDESGGGVTFSGGEPFSQADFLRELLLGCAGRELPVVLDTCGHAEPALFRELAPLASHLLFDLKLMDEERHEHYTGVHNRWILENLRWAGKQRRPGLTVRIPLIPGVNDDEENLRATARFVAGLPNKPPVDLLPYHRLGVDKYGRMGRRYGLGDVAPPTEEAVFSAVGLLAEAGLSVSVRGENHDHD